MDETRLKHRIFELISKCTPHGGADFCHGFRCGLDAAKASVEQAFVEEEEGERIVRIMKAGRFPDPKHKGKPGFYWFWEQWKKGL